MKKEYNFPICEVIEIDSLNCIASSQPELNDNDADNNKPVLSPKRGEWGNLWQ